MNHSQKPRFPLPSQSQESEVSLWRCSCGTRFQSYSATCPTCSGMAEKSGPQEVNAFNRSLSYDPLVSEEGESFHK